jgi:hypothetical protein
MINPASMIDPEKLKKIQEVTRYIKSHVQVDKAQGELTLSLASDNADAAKAIPAMLEELAGGLCQQLYMFFAIKSEWADVK